MDEDTLTPEYCLMRMGMQSNDPLRTLDNKRQTAGVSLCSDFSRRSFYFHRITYKFDF